MFYDYWRIGSSLATEAFLNAFETMEQRSDNILKAICFCLSLWQTTTILGFLWEETVVVPIIT